MVRRTACNSDISIQVAAKVAVALGNFTTGQVGHSASEGA
jgi:predicted RecA/RadA family phage recombinase